MNTTPRLRMPRVTTLIGAIALCFLATGTANAFKLKKFAKNPKKAANEAKAKAKLKVARKACSKLGKDFKHKAGKNDLHYCLAKKIKIPKKARVKPMCEKFTEGLIGFGITMPKGMKPYKCPKFLKPRKMKNTMVCLRQFKMPKILKKFKRVKPYCEKVNEGLLGIVFKF